MELCKIQLVEEKIISFDLPNSDPCIHKKSEGNTVHIKVAPYGYSLFVLRALVSTILGNLPITLSRTSLEPIEIKFWEIKLPF